MNKLAVRYPHAIIAAVILLTCVFAFGLRRGLALDASSLGYVKFGSQEKLDFESARKNFGYDDYLVVAVVCDDIFAPAALKRLQNLHDRISRIDGVVEVLSLINVPYARSIEGGASLEKLLPASFDDNQRLAEAKQIAVNERLYTGNLVSKDAKTAALNILIKDELPSDTRHAITERIYRLALGAGFDQSYLAGNPFSQWRGVEAIKRDLRVFLPVTIALIAVLLWLCFRSLTAVVLPLITIGIGLLWILGLMAYFNASFTILALMLPTLMLAIGCSYMIHVINQIGIVYTAQGEKSDKRELLGEALQFIGLPVMVSALTIIAGFLSLSFTAIPAIRQTAIYAAAGATFTMILSLTFVPAVLMILPRRAMAFRVGLTGKMVKLLEDVGRWATSHQKLLYILTVVIIMISLIGMWRIKIDIDYFHFFKPNTEPTIGLDQINHRLSGAVIFNIIIEGQRAGAIESSETLRRIAEFQAFAEQQKDQSGQGVDRTLSVADFIKHLNRAFNGNHPQSYVVPHDQAVVRDLLSDRDELKNFMTPDGRTARIMVRSNLSGSQAMAGVVRKIENQGREMFPDFRVYATGTFVLLNRTSDQIAGEQVQSISIALITIYLMLSILFRSFRVGLTAIVPNLIPVLFFFGFMGWGGIFLNLTTSLVASVVLGLAVDNSVQFIVRFRRMQNEHETEGLREPIIQSMRLSGRPIIYANIALAATFAVFALSNFEPVGSFGLLSAVTILGCLIEDLVLLPARLTSPVFRAK